MCVWKEVLCVCSRMCVCLNPAVFSSSHWRETHPWQRWREGGLTARYSFGQLLQIRTVFRKGYQFGSRWNTVTMANSNLLWMGYIFLEGAMEINESRESRNRTAEWRDWRTRAIHFHLQNPNRSKVMGRQERDLFYKMLPGICLRHPTQYLILSPPRVLFTGLFNLKVGK